MTMQEETVVEAAKGPGEKLKRARESFGLTVWEVASQLYLPERVMRALEEDDYHANLPARAFIRGYLRSYAKLLKLSPDEILSEFDALGIYKTLPEENLKAVTQPKAHAMHRDKFWFAVVGGSLFAVIMLIVSLTWLNSREEKKEDLVNQTLQEESLITTGEATIPLVPSIPTEAENLAMVATTAITPISPPKQESVVQQKSPELPLMTVISTNTTDEANSELVPPVAQLSLNE